MGTVHPDRRKLDVLERLLAISRRFADAYMDQATKTLSTRWGSTP